MDNKKNKHGDIGRMREITKEEEKDHETTKATCSA